METSSATPFVTPPRVRSVDLITFGTRWREEEHANPFHEFHWLRRGRLTLEIAGAREAAAPDDFLFIPRAAPHRDVFDADTPYEVLMVCFEWPPWETALAQRLTVDRLRALPADARREAAYLLDRLLAADARPRLFDGALHDALFHAVLLLLLSAGAADVADAADAAKADYRRRRDDWLVKEAMTFIAGNFHRRLTASEVARALGVSPFHLARQFAAVSGESLHAYLLARRFARAEALLLEGRLTVAQIAHATGFANGGYFAKAFRKRYGRTPKAFLAAHPSRTV